MSGARGGAPASGKISAPERRARLVVHALAGGMLVALALFADPILGRARDWGPIETGTLVAGLLLFLAGFFLRGSVARLAAQVCLSITTALVAVALAECLVRAAGFDVARQAHAWHGIAPFYRQPTVPLGEVFFRREGPEEWTGQVINTQMRLYDVSPNPYVHEPVITVRYDSLGFRDAGPLDDWDIVVTGDSFTELGYLRDDQLPTSILGRALDARVRNLGVSQTGPFTQLAYLEHYGVAASTKQAVVVFFEGNDFWDIMDEFEDLERWKSTGQREYRTHTEEHSLLRVADALWQSWRVPPRGPSVSIQAYFGSGEGGIPVTVEYTPATAAEVRADGRLMAALDRFLEQYADLGRERGIVTWLAFMPAKIRASHKHLRYAESAEDRFTAWSPTDLPGLVERLCRLHSVEFMDLTPALVEETDRSGEILYNTIYDTHLNAQGAAVVGRELARHLAARSAGNAGPESGYIRR